MAEKVQFERLRECGKCGYAACVCRVLREHKKNCTQRRAIMAEIPPMPCVPHDVVACVICYPCDCKEKK